MTGFLQLSSQYFGKIKTINPLQRKALLGVKTEK